MTDSYLPQGLLGTWRLISCQADVDSAVVQLSDDSPLGYLVYTPDEHCGAARCGGGRPYDESRWVRWERG
jgi:hypothetical protein